VVSEFLEIYSDKEQFEFECHDWVTGIETKYARLAADREQEIADYVKGMVKKGAVMSPKALAKKIGHNEESIKRVCAKIGITLPIGE